MQQFLQEQFVYVIYHFFSVDLLFTVFLFFPTCIISYIPTPLRFSLLITRWLCWLLTKAEVQLKGRWNRTKQVPRLSSTPSSWSCFTSQLCYLKCINQLDKLSTASVEQSKEHEKKTTDRVGLVWLVRTAGGRAGVMLSCCINEFLKD